MPCLPHVAVDSGQESVEIVRFLSRADSTMRVTKPTGE